MAIFILLAAVLNSSVLIVLNKILTFFSQEILLSFSLGLLVVEIQISLDVSLYAQNIISFLFLTVLSISIKSALMHGNLVKVVKYTMGWLCG